STERLDARRCSSSGSPQSTPLRSTPIPRPRSGHRASRSIASHARWIGHGLFRMAGRRNDQSPSSSWRDVESGRPLYRHLVRVCPRTPLPPAGSRRNLAEQAAISTDRVSTSHARPWLSTPGLSGFTGSLYVGPETRGRQLAGHRVLPFDRVEPSVGTG